MRVFWKRSADHALVEVLPEGDDLVIELGASTNKQSRLLLAMSVEQRLTVEYVVAEAFRAGVESRSVVE